VGAWLRRAAGAERRELPLGVSLGSGTAQRCSYVEYPARRPQWTRMAYYVIGAQSVAAACVNATSSQPCGFWLHRLVNLGKGRVSAATSCAKRACAGLGLRAPFEAGDPGYMIWLDYMASADGRLAIRRPSRVAHNA